MIVVTLSVFVSGVLAAQLIFHQCLWWQCAPKRDFTVFDLNLPSDLFPANAETHDLHFLRGDNVSIEAASSTNYWPNGVGIFVVRRFATEARASRHYDFDSRLKFTKPPGKSDLLLTYQSKNASNSTVQCGYVLLDYRCVYVARYAEFTVFFSGSIGDGAMKGDSFLAIVTYIDDKFSKLLVNAID
jgi:hypothetical protein